MVRRQPGRPANGRARDGGRRGRRRARRQLLSRGRERRRGSGRDAALRGDRPGLPGPGIFQRLNAEVERAAREAGARLELGFTNREAGPIYVGKLGWSTWTGSGCGPARSCRSARGRRAISRRSGPTRRRRTSGSRPGSRSHFVRSAAYLNWRYADSPRGYALVGVDERLRGRRPEATARGRCRVRRRLVAPSAREALWLLRRCARVARGARVLLALPNLHRAAYAAFGFVPTPMTIRLIGHALEGSASLGAGRLALLARRPRLLLAAMRSLVFVTQQVDPAHPVLAATIPKIAALAARVDEVAVLVDRRRAGRAARELRRAHVRREHEGRARRCASGARSRRELRRARRSRCSRTCVRSTRCSPRRSRVRCGVPLLLWFTHWHATPDAAARRACPNAILTVDRRSFPLASAKVARDRPRDRPRRVRLPEPRARVGRCGCSRSAATRRRRGSTSSSRAAAAVDAGLDARLVAHGADADGLERAAPRRARAARARARRRGARAARGRGSARRGRRRSSQRATCS